MELKFNKANGRFTTKCDGSFDDFSCGTNTTYGKIAARKLPGMVIADEQPKPAVEPASERPPAARRKAPKAVTVQQTSDEGAFLSDW